MTGYPLRYVHVALRSFARMGGLRSFPITAKTSFVRGNNLDHHQCVVLSVRLPPLSTSDAEADDLPFQIMMGIDRRGQAFEETAVCKSREIKPRATTYQCWKFRHRSGAERTQQIAALTQGSEQVRPLKRRTQSRKCTCPKTTWSG